MGLGFSGSPHYDPVMLKRHSHLLVLVVASAALTALIFVGPRLGWPNAGPGIIGVLILLAVAIGPLVLGLAWLREALAVWRRYRDHRANF